MKPTPETLFDDFFRFCLEHGGSLSHHREFSERTHALRDALAASELRMADADRLYYELILQVGTKYPNETRHETARRYLIEAERRSMGDGTPALVHDREG